MKNEDVQKIANLARLTLTPQETESLAKELTQILTFIENLNELDLTKIKPTAHAVEVDNVFRNDLAKSTPVIEDTLAHTKHRDGDFFVVPKVIG